LLHHSPPADAPDLDPTEGTQVLYIEVSNVGDLDINVQSIFSENPTIDFYLNKNTDGTCPTDVVVYLLQGGQWIQVEIGGHAHGPTRDPASDTATQCAYTQEVEHFSSYLVGTGSSGSGGGHDDHGSGGVGSGGTGSGGTPGHTDHGTSSSGSGGHGGHGGNGGTSGGIMDHGMGGILKLYPHQETITLITNQLNIFSIKYDLNQKIAWILAGTTGKPDNLAIESHGRQGGIVTAKLSNEQPYEQENQQYAMKRYLYEVPLSPIESYLRISADDRDYQLIQSVNIKEKVGEVIPWYASLTHGLLGDISEHDMSSIEGMREHESMDMDIVESLVDETGFGIKFVGQTSSVHYEDQEFDIMHSEEAHVSGIQVDEQLQGVSFLLEHAQQGEFTIKFPRKLVDAQVNDFIVFVNDSPDQQIDYKVIGSDPESFTMSVNLPADASSLTIVGSSVVPEFGAMALLVLIAGTIPIILLRKSTLLRM
jgi:predicted secreted protein with PEFG-CTERM motif